MSLYVLQDGDGAFENAGHCSRVCIYMCFRMEVEEEECREESEVEPDSDHEDETESQLSQWLGELENYAKVCVIV